MSPGQSQPAVWLAWIDIAQKEDLVISDVPLGFGAETALSCRKAFRFRRVARALRYLSMYRRGVQEHEREARNSSDCWHFRHYT
jgi:hypothetical protein